MKITPIQFNFVQRKPQNTVSTPLRMNNGLQTDIVNFSGLFKKEVPAKKPEKTLNDLVPKHKGIVYKKIKDEKGQVIAKEPVEVDIVKNGASDFEFEVDGNLIGGLRMSYYSPKNKEGFCNEKYKDYRREGIKGDRIIAEYIYNCKQEEYCGMGHLSDLIEVAACRELGFEPNVVSWSMTDAAPLHYMRGKRFVPFKRYNRHYQWYYHRKNPNDMVKEIIENTPKGQKFDTSKINHCFLTYMPKEMIGELEEELKEHPIF